MKKYKIKIENVVASANLHTEIPLEKVASSLPNTEYNPEQFPGLVLRLRKMRITSLIFSSGRIVCTGATNEREVKEGVRGVMNELKKLKIKFRKKPEIKIQNIVASGNLNMKLNLNSLAFKLENAEYEPEQFPGLVYHLPNSNITFLLFSAGKIVCTGARNEMEIRKAVETLIRNIKKAK
ncbi:MAG: TATA-box-binding protein [Candidatus Nanoarchaeia archaeon]|nr:TATA-box-binding protein [Candidatus Haiyanarchaeum thermophilum]MCW1303147.1 TATA-box-binding protein [Candidatus Haiyanarchaeum thermophilum]MCW1303812.1 TATA-box-binding protein [Candidatus Haiyanarchaeum thermophilum]MCW1306571.1 TATA-box-binding protein [Candidatus Haiyanarchaeum thermophilum]MCW1306985.1 TATA-box-binding protein [Candidatus Haiyanarchaeum thermophilum]